MDMEQAMEDFEVNDTLDLLWPQKRIFEQLNLKEYLMLCGMISYKINEDMRSMLDKELDKMNELTEVDEIVENVNRILRLLYNEVKEEYRSILKELGINLHIFFFAVKSDSVEQNGSEEEEEDENEDEVKSGEEVSQIRMLKKTTDEDEKGDKLEASPDSEDIKKEVKEGANTDDVISVFEIKDEARIQLELHERVNLSIRTEDGLVLNDEDKIDVKLYGHGTRFVIAERASQSKKNNHCYLL